jgi:5-methylcytosine-specific restriction endonuclease McrA
MIFCKRCNELFLRKHNAEKYCSICKPIHLKELRKKRKQTDKYKKWVKEYNKLPHMKKYFKQYTKSDKRKQVAKKYRESEKGKFAARKGQYNRRYREGNIIHKFTLDEWKNKVNKTKGICQLCKKYVGVENLTLDHIVPINKVKPNTIYTINDVEPLCSKCNSKKGDKMKKDVYDETLQKEINQFESIDEKVHDTIRNMGQIWKSCQDKMEEDNICFLCKKEFEEEEKFTIVKVPNEKTDKGLFVLAAVCNECNKEE